MKNYFLCIQCVFILNLYWISGLTEDGSIPTIGASINESENTSSDSVSEEVKISSDGGDVIRDLEPSVDVVGTFEDKVDSDSTFNKQLFVEATSQNSGVANDIATNGQPVVVTLADVATAELQRVIIPSQDENKEPSNLTQPIDTNDDIKPEINQSRSESNSSQETDNLDILKVKDNLTEEIPSFSEWAQKHLEAEKNREPLNTSTQHPNVNGKGKLRWKNYASLDCGAKVVASNPEAVSPSAILSPSRDEYKLNTCTSRIWFIVELCEAIQAKKIDFANFELFSSSPKDFVVSVSDRFPTREWSNVGQFTAKDERDIQSFDLDPYLFGKYIKVEVKSHYGSEHYCPISLFRVYGTSEFEVLQKEDPVHADRLEEDDDDDDDDESLDVEKGDSSKNLFSSATDAVISMVKKAAEVLGNKGNQSNLTVPMNTTKTSMVQAVRFCTSPSHLMVCHNCTDKLFAGVYELLSCHSRQIRNLVQARLIRDSLVTSNICQLFGLEFCKSATDTIQSSCIRAFFPDRFLGAMCNTIAVALNKVVLNTTTDYQNDTNTLTDEGNLVNIETSEPHIISLETQKETEATDTTPTLQATDSLTKSTCSTDVSYTSQIKPTKTLTSDLDLRASVTETSEDLNTVVTSTTEVSHSNTSEKIVEIDQNSESEKTMEIEIATESVEHLDDALEHFMDFNDRDQLPNAQTTQTTPQAQKESVFLRLSNRIKALERNMSLSGQYLEELSKRYKKQVEELQKLLDKTIIGMAEESKKKDERNKQLEERLTALTAAVEALIADRNSWSSTVFTIVVSSLVTLFILTFCCKIPEPQLLPTKSEVKRHKSIDLGRLPPPQKKKRRPSDQALKIVRSSMESSEAQAKRKKRKKQLLKRSNSISNLNEEEKPSWERQESAPPAAPVDWVEGKHFEEVPFVLEDSEHSTLEPLVVGAPNFLKTALNSRSTRVNGDVTRKSSSLDETGRVTANGGFGFGESTPKKEKKGLKRIFKKVF